MFDSIQAIWLSHVETSYNTIFHHQPIQLIYKKNIQKGGKIMRLPIESKNLISIDWNGLEWWVQIFVSIEKSIQNIITILSIRNIIAFENYTSLCHCNFFVCIAWPICNTSKKTNNYNPLLESVKSVFLSVNQTYIINEFIVLGYSISIVNWHFEIHNKYASKLCYYSWKHYTHQIEREQLETVT